jgi:hypothetical protein
VTAFKPRLRELLGDPSQITETDLTELEKLRSAYPWFQPVYPLIAAYHKKENLYSFQRQLKLASLYAGDRQLLREYLLLESSKNTVQQSSNAKEGSEKTLVETENQITAKHKVEQEEAPPFGSSEGYESEEENEDAPLKEPPKVESKVSSDPHEAQPSQIENSHSLTTEPISEEIESDSKIKEREDSNRFKSKEDSLDQSEESEESETNYPIVYNPLEELKKFLPEPKESTSEEQPAFPDHPIYDPEKELASYLKEDHEKTDDSEPHDFLYWLEHTDDKQEKTEHLPGNRIKSKIAEESTDVKDLLESFIHNRPKISRPKAEFFRAEKAAKKSEMDESHIVSESLAKLHIRQGHLSKAIDVYEKLILQNPHRKAYFAALIKEINDIKP